MNGQILCFSSVHILLFAGHIKANGLRYRIGLMALDTGCDLSHQRKAADFLYEHTQTLEEQLHRWQAMNEQH